MKERDPYEETISAGKPSVWPDRERARGANSQIGTAIAVALGRPGASVVVNYGLQEEEAAKVVEEIRRCETHALAVPADVSKETDAHQCLRAHETRSAPLTLLVNNAGLRKEAPSHELTPDMGSGHEREPQGPVSVCARSGAFVQEERGCAATCPAPLAVPSTTSSHWLATSTTKGGMMMVKASAQEGTLSASGSTESRRVPALAYQHRGLGLVRGAPMHIRPLYGGRMKHTARHQTRHPRRGLSARARLSPEQVTGQPGCKRRRSGRAESNDALDYFFASSAGATVPPAFLHFASLIIAQPLPLHSFCPLHELAADLQPLLPLHEFPPSQWTLPPAKATEATGSPAANMPATVAAIIVAFVFI